MYSQLSYYRVSHFHNFTFIKFLNHLIKKGKKKKAESILFRSFFYIKRFLLQNDDVFFEKNPYNVFFKAISNLKPILQLKNVRTKGKSMQIPKQIPEYKKIRLSIQWLIDAASSYRTKGRNKKPQGTTKKQSPLAKKKFSERLYMEIIKAALGKGKAIEKKLEVHRKAYSLRANTKRR